MQLLTKARVRVPARSSRSIAPVAHMSAMPEVETAHHAASLNARDMRSWVPPRLSPDAAWLRELDTTIARVEDLARNNGWIAGAEQTHLDNIIGPSLRLVATPDYKAIGKTKEWADEWADGVQGLWRSFADTEDFDAGGRLDFDQMTRLMFRSTIQCGEAIALPLWLPARGETPWATTMQVIDPARLCSPPSWRRDEVGKRAGIEYDRFGKPKAYWFRKNHPGETYATKWDEGEWERVPAAMQFGRMRVLHIYEQSEVNLSRGKPLATPVVRESKMLDMYAREELRAAIFNSMICAALETPLDQNGVSALFGLDNNASMAGATEQMNEWGQYQKHWDVKLEGGSVLNMPPGTKLNPFIPARPAGAFDAFTTATLRHLAVGLNMPYELLSKDFSKTNYSSARAALMEAWRYFIGKRRWFASQWADNIFWLWLEEAVNDGKVDAPGYYDNRVAYQRCKWIGAGRGWIDPVKEAQAAKLRMDTGLSTLADEAAEQGNDWREVIEQQVTEEVYRMKARESAGLDPVPPVPGAALPTDDGDEDDAMPTSSPVATREEVQVRESIDIAAAIAAAIAKMPAPVVNIESPHKPKEIMKVTAYDEKNRVQQWTREYVEA